MIREGRESDWLASERRPKESLSGLSLHVNSFPSVVLGEKEIGLK